MSPLLATNITDQIKGKLLKHIRCDLHTKHCEQQALNIDMPSTRSFLECCNKRISHMLQGDHFLNGLGHGYYWIIFTCRGLLPYYIISYNKQGSSVIPNDYRRLQEGTNVCQKILCIMENPKYAIKCIYAFI